MKYLKKLFHEVKNYPMPIINSIAKQELNHSQSKKKGPETNKTSNKIQLVLPLENKVTN